ncbi:hypothetical protein WICPIJ_008714 [Wickerhamomyces pijperi]|uniref:Major facilitator superfamily (MFS) profile domain-containing protein n=1 Tax=Wickerhamomyces pijperi TaxID=599730 RepID=A0A9P8PVI5_WICPI|nr:hypothetical protein WICPIJ_008714 [Wickerhamomyces pijperi]
MSESQSSSTHSAEKPNERIHSVSEKEVQQHGYKVIQSKDADATLAFQRQYDSEVPEITAEQEKKLSRKVTWYIMALVCWVNLVLYMDKATLSYATMFELFTDTGLTQNRYSNINTLFYVGFAVGQIPGNYLLLKLPIGWYLVGLTSSWTVIIFLTCLAKNYGGLIALRFFLGFVEASILPLMNVTMGQFLTSAEKAATAPIFYSTCLGVTIPTGFIAYGVLYADTTHIHGWKIFYIIIGGLTFITTLLVLFLYPNNPAEAKFLTVEERIWTIRRVQRTTGASIEQKTFKKHQMVEALKDKITWLFGLFFLLQQLANNLPYQQNLLFTGMGGLSNLNSTLVSVASGGFAVVLSLFFSAWLYLFPSFPSLWLQAISLLPSFVGSIVAVSLPWDNKKGLLAALCLASPAFGVNWILMFSLNQTTAAGYTKKITRNAFVMFWYCVANIISPQLWRSKDAPRYYPAWIVQIVLSFFVAPILGLVIYYILKKRNDERLAAVSEDNRVGVVQDDSETEFVVNVASLDLTDLENKAFIYPL